MSIALVHARQTAAACPCIPEGRGRALEGAWKRESRTASRRARKGSTAAPMWYTVDEIRPSCHVSPASCTCARVVEAYRFLPGWPVTRGLANKFDAPELTSRVAATPPTELLCDWHGKRWYLSEGAMLTS